MLCDFWCTAVRDQIYLERRHWSNDFLNEEGEPLIECDGAVPILIHLGKGLLPLLRQLERSGQTKTLLGGRCNRDHRWEFKARNLTVPVCVSCLEALPGEPVDLLAAL